MSDPVPTCMWKYFPFIFTFSLVFVGVFSVKISVPPLSSCVSLSSSTFLYVHTFGAWFFSFANGTCLTKGWSIIFPWRAVRHCICIEFRFCAVRFAFVRLLVILFFFIISSCCTNSIHVSTVKLTLWSVSNNLCLKSGSCITSIKRRMINSSSVVFSPVPRLSNSQYLALSFNRCIAVMRELINLPNTIYFMATEVNYETLI